MTGVVPSPGSGGMSNPMTAAQDLIVGGSSGTPTRLAAGTPAQKLGVNLAGVVTYVGPERVPIFPSGDTTGATDDTNMLQAIAALPNGGDIVVVAGATPFYTTAGWSPPAQTTDGIDGGGPVSLQGVGMPVLMPVGAAKTGIYYHRSSRVRPPGDVRDRSRGRLRPRHRCGRRQRHGRVGWR